MRDSVFLVIQPVFQNLNAVSEMVYSDDITVKTVPDIRNRFGFIILSVLQLDVFKILYSFIGNVSEKAI